MLKLRKEWSELVWLLVLIFNVIITFIIYYSR